MRDSDNGGAADVPRMAAAMREQAEEIERLRMELQRTSIRQKESIPELTPGALDEFVQEERVAQWMRMCVGALKEYLEQATLPVQRPQNHEGANEQGAAPPPRSCVGVPGLGSPLQVAHDVHDEVQHQSGPRAQGQIALCLAGGGQGRPGDRLPLEEREVQRGRRSSELADTRRGVDPGGVGAVGQLQTVHAERGSLADTTLAFPVSPLELNTARGGRTSRGSALRTHRSR